MSTAFEQYQEFKANSYAVYVQYVRDGEGWRAVDDYWEGKQIGIVAKQDDGGWRFFPWVDGHRPSRKSWPTPKAAVPTRWVDWGFKLVAKDAFSTEPVFADRSLIPIHCGRQMKNDPSNRRYVCRCCKCGHTEPHPADWYQD